MAHHGQSRVINQLQNNIKAITTAKYIIINPIVNIIFILKSFFYFHTGDVKAIRPKNINNDAAIYKCVSYFLFSYVNPALIAKYKNDPTNP
jgi:hypothetical protein